MTTFDKLAAVTVAHLGCDDDKVTDAATFEDLGADSIDIVELVMAFEEEFEVEITDDEAADADTVGKMVALVDSKLAVKQAA